MKKTSIFALNIDSVGLELIRSEDTLFDEFLETHI